MIKLENISKNYNSRTSLVSVLSDVSFSVPRGSLLLLHGPSGAGKTTLLNILACLTRPTSGRVIVGDRDVCRLPEHFLCEFRRKEIGFIFQQFNLISGHTLLENITIPLLPLGISPQKRAQMAGKNLSLLGLEDRKEFDVSELSGGEQQRAAVARALVNDPDIILADEPTSNLDEENTDFIIDIFKKIKRDGKTLVLSSHDTRIVNSGLVDDVYEV